MNLRSLSLWVAFVAAVPASMAADTAPVTLYINDGAARPISSLSYTSGFLMANFVGFTFCTPFAGTSNPNSVVSFLPTHDNFFGAFSVNGVTNFSYVGVPGGAQARLAVCPLNAAGQQVAGCNGFKVSCLSMDSTGSNAGDEKSLFRSGFDERVGGSYVTITNTTRPTASNPNLVVGVDYHIPGSSAGLPSQSYAANITYDAAQLNCPFGSESFFATAAPQTIHRNYTCPIASLLPPAGVPLMAVMLFMEPGTATYHPAADSAADNMALVRM